MDLFVSTIRYAFSWLLHKPERPMHDVAEWLKENDLHQYITKFEEYGWDKLSVLSEMTEGDIEMCIQKPGHKAAFKRALKNLRLKLDNPSSVPCSCECKTVYQETREKAVTEATPFSATNSPDQEKDDSEGPLLETGSFNQHFDIGVVSDISNNENDQSDSESDQKLFFDDKESITTDFQNINVPVKEIYTELFTNKNKEDTKLLAGVEDHHTTDNLSEPDSHNEEYLMAEPENIECAVSGTDVSCNVNNEIADTTTL